MTRHPDTVSSEIEAVRAALMTCLDTRCTGVLGALNDLKWTTDQLLDHVIVEQFTWAREGLERLAPLVDDCEAHLQNFSNQLTEGTAMAKVTGWFVGSGRTVVGANFRPETQGLDFALAANIEDTDMRALNRPLRAYGKFDAVQGFFSVYTEMRVRNREVQGYVKPLVRELDVYDTRQDKEKNLFQTLYEAVVGSVSALQENTRHDEVATKVDLD